MTEINKNILIESTKSQFQVLPNKPANVLKRIKGVLSDFKSNRNGRIYPRELWENVVNSDYVKEMINSHGLVGELDHPEDRLEISLQNVSHVINDMWIEGDQVLGVIDILPTPNGKIINELLDYGTDIGISSRGSGSVGANNVVDPDYQFITFDFVARPSCEAARLNTILEGVQYDLQTNSDDKVNAILESYKSELKESQTQEIVDVVKDMRKKNPRIDEYITDYYRDINKFEPQPRWLKDEDRANPEWDKWYKEYCNFLYSPKAYENFKRFVKEEFNDDLKESTILEYGDDAYYANQENDRLNREISNTKAKYKDAFRTIYSLACGMGNILLWDSSAERKLEKLTEEINKLKDLSKKYKDGNMEESTILEAAMSDQDVYKAVLGWYKDQIEKGNMTLNQCYELLSDKAKVSLNKLVDQSKIKESIMNNVINNILTESAKKNYICIRPVKHPNIGTLVGIDEVVSEDNTKVSSEELNRYYKEYNGPIYTVKINGEPMVNFSNFDDAEEYSLERMEWDNGKFTVEGPDGEQVINESVTLKEGAEQKINTDYFSNFRRGHYLGETGYFFDVKGKNGRVYTWYYAPEHNIVSAQTGCPSEIRLMNEIAGLGYKSITSRDAHKILADYFSKHIDELMKEKGLFKESEDISSYDNEDLQVSSPQELNTGLFPNLLDTDQYSRMEQFYTAFLEPACEDGETIDDYDIDMKALDEEMLSAAEPILDEYFKKVLPSANVKVKDYYHPKYYNYSGDEINFNLSFDTKEFYDLEQKALNDPEFRSYLKERFASRSGFYSFMADNLDDYYKQDGWKKLVEVLNFYLDKIIDDEEYDEIQERFIDYLYSNSFPVVRVSETE